MLSPEKAVILIAEDRPDDVLLIKRAFAEAKVHNPIFVVPDGEKALAYLDGIGAYSDRTAYPLPDLILLDLKMPKMDGFEVLRAMRNRPDLRRIRVIVLTSSEDIFDINKAYELGASSFLVKPVEFQNFAALMRTLSYFWLQRNALPGLASVPLSQAARQGSAEN